MVNGKYVYPRVYGFTMGYSEGGADINGFKITKYGIDSSYCNPHVFRNNYFENCGIAFSGVYVSDSQVINNKFTNGTVHVGMDAWNVTVTGCTFNKCKDGVAVTDLGDARVSKNMFSYCKNGVHVYTGGGAEIAGNSFKYCTTGIRVEEDGHAVIDRSNLYYGMPVGTRIVQITA